MADRYHHGDLPNALRAAAAEVIIEKGLGAFSLREVARRAGVSHAAPAHHFGDTTGLLTSLAVEAFDTLRAALTEAVAEPDPIARLTAVGRAYVGVARSHPAHSEIVFRHDLVDPEDPAYIAAGLATYAVLLDTVRAVAEAVNPDLDIDDAARLAWAAMQGLIVLYPKMGHIEDKRVGDEPLAPIGEVDALIERFTALMIDGFRARP